MTFDPAVPQANEIISTSQPKLLENFSQLNSVFGVNHVPFNDVSANKGKHNYVTYVEQTADPVSQDNEYLVYSKELSGSAELYARPQLNADPFLLTKGGSIYLGIIPVVAVNFDSTGAIQGTALNVSSITVAGNIYTINFPALTSNNYFWNISGFASTVSSTPVSSQVANGVLPGTTSIQVSFIQGSSAIAPYRASLIIWRFQ